jgi:hypothetical protein
MLPSSTSPQTSPDTTPGWLRFATSPIGVSGS